MKRKYVYIAILLAAASLMTGMVGCQKREETTLHIGEPVTAPHEWPAEPSTEVPTEVPTEAPTEAPTEKPTEPPTEPATEAPTEPEPPIEPEIEFTIDTRSTMLEGTPVEFNIFADNSPIDTIEGKFFMVRLAAFEFDPEYEWDRAFELIAARSLEEYKENFSSLLSSDYKQSHPEIEKYNKVYFKEKAVLVLLQGGRVDEVVKNGAELCIGTSTTFKKRYDISSSVDKEPSVQLIEVSKADLDGVDTISLFVKITKAK